MEAAGDGGRVEVAAGVYVGDLDFAGRAVHLVGSGPATVVQGTGAGPVVRFVSGEPRGAVLDSLTVTGGAAATGGGVEIRAASPTLVRVHVVANRATQRGSGIYVGEGGAPLLANLLVAYNGREGPGDPHQIEVDDSAPVLVNATVVRGDSNGLLLRGDSAARVRSSVFARNGSRAFGRRRGRGICDFSAGRAEIAWSVFHRNRRAALLRDGRDWKRIARFQKRNPGDAALHSNLDGRPGFVAGPRRRLARQELDDLALRDRGRARARDAGDPDPACDDLDGTRNDAGHGGGPFAAPSTAVPTDGGCGAG